eukprot:1107003-Rhodomonas_salina.2
MDSNKCGEIQGKGRKRRKRRGKKDQRWRAWRRGGGRCQRLSVPSAAAVLSPLLCSPRCWCVSVVGRFEGGGRQSGERQQAKEQARDMSVGVDPEL